MKSNLLPYTQIWFDEASTGGGTNPTTEQSASPTITQSTDPNQKESAGSSGGEIVFEDWLKSQPVEIQESYKKHTSGLLNSVRASRRERDEYSEQLKEALKKVQAGSELEQQLRQLQKSLEESKRTEVFFDDALRPEIGCSNPRGALFVAKAGDLFGKDGKPLWDEIKKIAPEFFIQKKSEPQRFEGGKGMESGVKPSMSDLIRKAAGR